MFGIAIFAFGVMTTPIHLIAPAWIALTPLFFLLAFNFLRGSEFRDKIDWAFLMYLAGLVGMVAAMSHLGLSKFLASHLGWLSDIMRGDFPLFVLILTALLFTPINAAVSISAAILLPLAGIYASIPVWKSMGLL